MLDKNIIEDLEKLIDKVYHCHMPNGSEIIKGINVIIRYVLENKDLSINELVNNLERDMNINDFGYLSFGYMTGIKMGYNNIAKKVVKTK